MTLPLTSGGEFCASRGVRNAVVSAIRLLNARDNVTEFYAKHGYAVVGEAETLFGVIRHVRMAKSLS